MRFWPFGKKAKKPTSPIASGIVIAPNAIPPQDPEAKPEMEDGWAKEYPHFTAKVIEKISNGQGYWNYLDIGVFQQDASGQEPYQIGQYRRNYSAFYNTFSATRKGDKFYALYSPYYTGTRVLEITPGVGIKDIGGEEKDSDGFCPTELYIPKIHSYVGEQFHCGPFERIKDWDRILDFYPAGTRIISMERKSLGRKKVHYDDGKDVRAYTGKKSDVGTAWERDDYRWVWGPEKEYGYVHLVLPPEHAFVAGCYWGDDSSWKIQHFDVSRIDEGIIVRDDRFGYIELPDHLTLKQAVRVEDPEESGGRIRIAIQLDFDLETGGVVDWNDLKSQIEKGQPIMDKHNSGNDEWRKNFKALDEDMKRRWYGEEGEAIRKWVKENGGKID